MSFEEYLSELRKTLARFYHEMTSQVPIENPDFPFTGVSKQHWEVMITTLGIQDAKSLQKNLTRFASLYRHNSGFRIAFYEDLPKLIERLPEERNPLIQAVLKLRLDSGFSPLI